MDSDTEEKLITIHIHDGGLYVCVRALWPLSVNAVCVCIIEAMVLGNKRLLNSAAEQAG